MTAPALDGLVKCRAGRKIVTSFVYPPIPWRNFDWCATFDDYDGAPDAGPQWMGTGETEQEAINDLIQQVEDDAD